MIPLVSVIMPCGNGRWPWLIDAVRAVLYQTMPDLELIVIEDGIDCQLYSRIADSRLRVLGIPARVGPGGARNVGIAAARGRWIAFCDADDVWFIHKLETQLEKADQDAILLCSGYERMDENGESMGCVVIPPRPQVRHADLLRGACPIGNLTAMYDTNKCGKVFVRSGVTSSYDLSLWLDLLRSGGHGQCLPDVLARYRVHRGSVSANKLRQVVNRTRLLRMEGQPWPAIAASTVSYAMTSLARRTA